MHRFFTEPENITGTRARIIEDAAHISRVLRMKLGDSILLFDGTGMEYTANLTRIAPGECLAEIKEAVPSLQEPETQVTIFQGIPKSGKMEGIIQKAVELGVSTVVPTVMDRCVARMEAGKKEQGKLERWNKIALEAAKQCGRGKVPEVKPATDFSGALAQAQALDLAVMPYEVLGHQGDHSLKQALASVPFKSLGVLIGPEGGFSDAEALAAQAAGVTQVGLGRRILRTETVSAAVLAMVMYEKNEL